MATTIKDIRTVRINVTVAELNNLLSAKAIEAGLIDLEPDRLQVMEIDPTAGT